MKPFAVIDSETDPFRFGRVPVPFIWGYYNGREYYRFFTTEELVSFIGKRNEIIYAHNGGRFDFHFLIEHVSVGKRVKIINGRIAEFKIGRATLRDSYLILPTALSASQKDDFDYTKLEENVREQHMGEIEEYLRHDCEYLFQYVHEFFQTYPQKLTLAACAVDMFKQIQGVDMCHLSNAEDKEFRKFYFGGRVQALQTGVVEGELKLYDINSAYPDAMTHYHPWGRDVIEYPAWNNDDPIEDTIFYRANVDITAPSLMVREKNRLTMPTGKGITVHAVGVELRAAIELGHAKLNRVEYAWEFLENINFKGYVDHFFKLKKEAKEAGDRNAEIYAKLFLNSLYGKLATDITRFYNYKTAHYEAIPEGYIPVSDGIGDRLEIVIVQSEENASGRYYNVATAASITARVRAKLMRALAASEGAIYCDTDSIIAAHLPLKYLGKELGQWDVEAVADKAAIAGKKLYALWNGDKVVKSSSKGARLTASQIERVAMGETVTWRNEAPTFSIGAPPSFVERTIKRTA